MTVYVIRRLLQAVLVIFVMTLIVFFGVNVIGTKTVAVIVLTGHLFDRVEFFINIALLYALINFIGALALSRYFERKGVLVKRSGAAQ